MISTNKKDEENDKTLFDYLIAELLELIMTTYVEKVSSEIETTFKASKNIKVYKDYVSRGNTLLL